MFRNQYDNDITVWSPQGRIHQIEYAMEAVKLGSVTLALKNKDFAIVAGIKRSTSKLIKSQQKIMEIDDHVACTMSGLLADGQQLAKFMRSECLDSKWSFECPLAVERLARTVANRSQKYTQQYGRRPYGVGLLLIGYDETGPRVFQTCPSANYYECECTAIGSRSQSARTYLERNLDAFKFCSLEELINHGLQALSNSLGNDQEMTKENVELGYLGKECNFRKLTEVELEIYLQNVETKKPSRNVAAQDDQAQQPTEGDQQPTESTDDQAMQ